MSAPVKVRGMVLWLPEDLHAALALQASYDRCSVEEEVVNQLRRMVITGSLCHPGLFSPRRLQLDELLNRKIDNPPVYKMFTPGDPLREAMLRMDALIKDLRVTPDTLLNEPKRRPFTDRMKALGMVENYPIWAPLQGQRWAISGQLVSMNKDRARERLTSLGAMVVGSVDRCTTVLLVGRGANPHKQASARAALVDIWQESEFMRLLEDLGVQP